MGWLGVEPRHLAGLVEVRREGSFRGAAARLGVVQSAVSERIAQLERLVGVPLVNRSRGRASVALTDAGTRLAEHAEHILAELDAALADLRADGTLRLGAHDGVAGALLPRALGRLAGDVRVELRQDADWRRLLPLVASGEIDAAFAELPLPRGPFAFRELLQDACALIVPADSPLARRGAPPTLAELASLPLIASGGPFREALGERFRAGGVEPRFTGGSHGDAAAQALVAHGGGAALLPRLAVNHDDPRIAVIPLDGVLPPRRVVLAWHRDRRELSAITTLLEALEAEPARELTAA